MTFLAACLRLAIDVARTEPELRAQIESDTAARTRLPDDERAALREHTRARLVRIREGG